MKSLFVLSFGLLLLGCTKPDETRPSDFDPAKWEVLESNSEKGLYDIHFVNNKVGIAGGSLGLFLKTTDSGKTWQSLKVGVNSSFASVFAVNENTFYTARVGLYKSENSGTSFKEVGNMSVYAGVTIFDIEFLNPNDGFIIKGPVLLKTHDGGNSWTQVYDVYTYKNMQFTSGKVGYISGGMSYDGRSSGGIIKTEDGGNTWRNLPFQTSEILAAYFVDDTLGYIFNFNRQLFKTTDGGKIWNLLPAQIEDYLTDMLFLNENIGYASAYGGKIFKTIDGGKSWQIEYQASQKVPLTSLAATPDGTIYAVGNQGIILKRKH